ALYAEATAAFQTGDFEKAGVKYQLALERARILKDEAGVGSSLAMLGSVHHALKQYSKALEFYSAALPHFAAANNRSPEAFTLRQIGDVHRQMGNYNMALQAFDRSLTIWDDLFAKGNTEEKLDITRERAPILFFKAGAHENLGQLAEAVKTYSDAAADFQTTGELKTAGSALWGAAETSMKMSLYFKKWEIYPMLLGPSGALGWLFFEGAISRKRRRRLQKSSRLRSVKSSPTYSRKDISA
ncbi:MAG: tetratricopeptide repeat protein, partial [Deltaproteobacteria bacterium]